LLKELWEKASKPSQAALVQECADSGIFGYINHLLQSEIPQTEEQNRDIQKINRFMQGYDPLEDEEISKSDADNTEAGDDEDEIDIGDNEVIW
jgi:hypothetical protein